MSKLDSFDPDNIKFTGKNLDEWLKGLPENTNLRIFHTEDNDVRLTWLEWKKENTVFLVGESK